MKPPKLKPKTMSSFRLASLLRLQKDPNLALHLFQNPNSIPNPKPFRYSLLCYDLIISKLGRAKMFDQMEQILLHFKTHSNFAPKEPLFCHIMTFYGRAGLPHKALKLFDEMPLYRCQRTIKSYNTLLNVLMIRHEFDIMREHFVNIERNMRPDACTFNIMIRGLCSNGQVDDAVKLFDEMTKRDIVPSQVTFGTLIHGLCSNRKLKEAFELKDYMIDVHKLPANEHVYATLVKGLCSVGELNLAFKLKKEMESNGVKVDSAIYATLINALFKLGRKDEVFGVLKEMETKNCKRDTVTYNVIINGFCKDKDFKNAYKILDEMSEKGCKPDVIGYNVLLGELCKNGKCCEANELFEDMPRRGCAADVVSYRILFDGFSDAMQLKEAVDILDEMVFKGFKPRSSSICKFVDRLCQQRNVDLLWSALNCLGKVNAIDRGFWEMGINMSLKDTSFRTQEQLMLLEKCLVSS